MKRILIVLGAVLALGLSITGVVLIVRQQRQLAVIRHLIASGPVNLAREEALDRQQGMMLGPAQMQAPLPPSSQNAASLYTKLTLLLKQKPLHLPKYAENMTASHTYTPAQIAWVRRTLATRQDVMVLVHQAADRPKCVFVRNWSLGADVQFPEYQPMREATRLITDESYLLGRDGHYQEAIADQQRGFRIAEHAASDPALIAFLVGIACDTNTLTGMQSILAFADPNQTVDDEVRGVVAAKQPRFSLKQVMTAESGFGCACIANMHQRENNGFVAAFTAGGFPPDKDLKVPAHVLEGQDLHHLIDAWQTDYLAHMRILVTACNLPPLQRKLAFAAADKRLQLDGDDPSNFIHLLTIFLMPTITKLEETPTRVQARQVITLAAAILSGKAKIGAFPKTLPSGCTDPFTNKPLGYRLEGRSGFVVYSAGPTGSYDGGERGEKVPPQESVFRYPADPLPLTPDMLK